MKHNRTAIILAIGFFQIASAGSLDKKAVLAGITKKTKKPACAYSAKVIMKVSVQGNVVVDTGLFHFSPPNKQFLEFKNTKTKTSTIGDTTWIRTRDGTITRRIGAQAGPSPGGGPAANPIPDLSSLLKTNDFEIVKQRAAKDITIEFFFPVANMKQKIRAVYDINDWLLRRYTIIGMPGGDVETGLSYETFNKTPVIKEIRTVMPMGGFLVFSFSHYKKTKPKPDSAFRLM